MNQPKKSAKVFLLFVTIHVLLVSTTWGQSTSITPPAVSGRAASPETILPADVLARVQWFHEELEAIRLEMGKPKDRRVTRLATNALPHEVYFQAITLFIKADRLALELTGSTGLRPQPVAPSAIRPYHTWALVTAAFDRLVTIKNELGIQESVSENASPAINETDRGGASHCASKPATQPHAAATLYVKRCVSANFVGNSICQSVISAVSGRYAFCCLPAL